MNETITLECPDRQTRSFLIQREGFFNRSFVVYEQKIFGNNKIGETSSRESVADLIRIHYPKWTLNQKNPWVYPWVFLF